MAIRRHVLKAQRFHDLMPYRVREVLLVSSPYDAFILQEDGLLTEQVFFEYRELGLSSPPRFTHVPSAEAALHCLERQRCDLILTMTSLADMSINDFGRRIKELRPGRPVVVLSLDSKELHDLAPTLDPQFIDATFLWSGHPQILLAILMHIEDHDNVDHDIELGDVRVIIMVEDSPRYYSAFLGMLYKELMAHSHSLYSEGVNELHRRMLMKSRPKILHATSYETGIELFRCYRSNVMAVISDVRIPRRGALDPTAGLDFARTARREVPGLPVLLQSADPTHVQQAAEIRASFVDKGSPTMLAEIRGFLTQRLGFGPFVFRRPDGKEVDRARDLRELEAKVATVDESCLAYHAARNHFSIWLMARSEFELAERLRPQKFSDFPSLEAMRRYLMGVLQETRESAHRGVVSDFDRQHVDRKPMSRLGQGSLGGKARGLAFLNRSLASLESADFGGLIVKVPRSIVVTTDAFDHFMESNQLRDFAYGCCDDELIAERFLRSRLADALSSHLEFIVQRFEGPMAVRSSSLLEDSMQQPFAGIYTTLMIPNNEPDPALRLRQVESAVKLVYASTFYRSAKSYLASTGNRLEEEKMAVILQEVVGRGMGRRFYPTFSGVAQSQNFYPIAPLKGEDGVAYLALGLGRTVVGGHRALRFSPRHPAVVPQLGTTKELLETTQRGFYALDLAQATDLRHTVKHFELKEAEEDGTLLATGSVFCPDDGRLREDLTLSGPRVVTFNGILQHRAIPLAQALDRILEIGAQGFGCAVEVEFAGDLGDWGAAGSSAGPRPPELCPLQIRPMASPASLRPQAVRMDLERCDVLCFSHRSLGHGVRKGLRDLVYVRRQGWEPAHNRAIARQVGQLNQSLAGRPYVLIGPGRWGTNDPWLGIPVQWSQISGVTVLVEASPRGYHVEPSQGTHFLQNITSLSIGHLTLPAGADARDPAQEEYLDWEWLDRQPACAETDHLRHVRWDEPMTVVLDGCQSRGLIVKPGVSP